MSKASEVANSNLLDGCIDTSSIFLAWSEAPWDTEVYGYPVLQITGMKIRGTVNPAELDPFVVALDASNSVLASCRMPHGQLRESMLLEEIGFRFIEMLYQPEFTGLQSSESTENQGLSVMRATAADLPEAIDAAGRAFRNERFHVDPRLPSSLGDIRYQNWVRNCLNHATQRLYVLRDGRTLVAFFVVEYLADGTCYWHLNAVVPALQGKGYGLQAWRTMLEVARRDGATRVRTSIVARNHRVLNLYARLGFRFPAPLMTFHWVRGE